MNITAEYLLSRLKDEYDKHKKLVIGFDFDNTVFDVHNKGIDCSEVIKLLQKAKEEGFILCLYTAELRPEWLDWKVMYCKHFGIEPDYVNESPLLKGTSKPFFNLLIDDRAGLPIGIYLLQRIIEYAKDNQITNENSKT